MTEGVRHLEKAFEHGYPDAQIALGIENISLQKKNFIFQLRLSCISYRKKLYQSSKILANML